MDINKKITYKGWIESVIIANGWDKKTVERLMKITLTDLKGMCQTWLRYSNNTYVKTYLLFINRFPENIKKYNKHSYAKTN